MGCSLSKEYISTDSRNKKKLLRRKGNPEYSESHLFFMGVGTLKILESWRPIYRD